MRATTKIMGVLGLAVFGAACGGGGSGETSAVSGAPPPPAPPPPAPPPSPPIACAGADTFPAFLFEVEATPTSPEELHLASSDGCRTELVSVVPDLRSGTQAVHMTSDGSKGVIVWSEQPVNNQYIIRRQDFTVDNVGNLDVTQPVTVLPLVGKEALPGDNLLYISNDIWGDATHDSLYMTVLRTDEFNSGPNAGEGTTKVLIYNLNDLTDVNSLPDVRVIYEEGAGDWQDAIELDCASVFFPQFVPTCFGAHEPKFNPSGTRLYLQDNINDHDGERWDAALRIHIDMSGGPGLANWVLTGPELVYTAMDGPNGMVPRPEDDVSVLPSPEYTAVFHQDGGAITQFIAILNADQCAVDYAPYADGMSEAPFDLWQGCLDNSTFFTGNLHGSGTSWQSPESLLKNSFQDPDYDIHRVYVSGGLAGIEQLLIETARFADTGY